MQARTDFQSQPLDVRVERGSPPQDNSSRAPRHLLSKQVQLKRFVYLYLDHYHAPHLFLQHVVGNACATLRP